MLAWPCFASLGFGCLRQGVRWGPGTAATVAAAAATAAAFLSVFRGGGGEGGYNSKTAGGEKIPVRWTYRGDFSCAVDRHTCGKEAVLGGEGGRG